MIEDTFFFRTISVDVDAAMIGIGRSRWISIKPEDESVEKAIAIIKQGRFDVLPINPGDSYPIYHYFSTSRPHCWTDKTVKKHT